MLPIIEAKLHVGPQETRPVVTFLDSGSQLSFIRQGLVQELSLEGEDIQLDFVTVGGKTSKLKTKTYFLRSTLISCIYRKPGTNIAEFSDKIEELFGNCKNKNMYLCGDLNIDLLKYETH